MCPVLDLEVTMFCHFGKPMLPQGGRKDRAFTDCTAPGHLRPPQGVVSWKLNYGLLFLF